MGKKRYHMKKLKSGYQTGPSHEDGGITGKIKGTNKLIEFEGKEIIVNERKNSAASKHKKGLLGLNKDPDKYKIVKINKKGEIPMAKKGGLIQGGKWGSGIKKFAAKMKERSQARKQKRKSRKIQKLADKGVKIIGDPKGANLKGRIRKGVKEITTTKGGAYATYGKKSKAAGSFRGAFASARKAGKKTFSWDGRSYSTAVAKKPAALPDSPKSTAKQKKKVSAADMAKKISSGDKSINVTDLIKKHGKKAGGGMVGDSIKTYSSGGYVEGE